MTNQKRIEASNDVNFGVADVSAATSNKVAFFAEQESNFIKALRELVSQKQSISAEELAIARNLLKSNNQEKAGTQVLLLWDGSCLFCGESTGNGGQIPRNRITSYRNSLKPGAYWEITVKVRTTETHKVFQSVEAYALGDSEFLCRTCAAMFEDQKKRDSNKAKSKAIKEQHRYNYAMAVSTVNHRTRQNVTYYLRYAFPDEVGKKMALLPYQQFLNTEYWQLIRKAAIHNADYRCEMCNTSNRLEVHLLTYKHRGYEFRHMEDLTVVCHSSHASHHGKEN